MAPVIAELLELTNKAASHVWSERWDATGAENSAFMVVSLTKDSLHKSCSLLVQGIASPALDNGKRIEGATNKAPSVCLPAQCWLSESAVWVRVPRESVLFVGSGKAIFTLFDGDALAVHLHANVRRTSMFQCKRREENWVENGI